MEERPKREPFLNQNMIIAIIGAAATIIAALIPTVVSNLSKNEPAPTATSVPSTEPPTFTAASPTAGLTAAVGFTATLAEPTVTATTMVVPTPSVGFYDVYLANDPGGRIQSSTYSSGRTVYVIFKINDPTGEGAVTATWRVVDVPGEDSNSVKWVTDYTVTAAEGLAQVVTEGWKPGKYEVELLLNDLPFTSWKMAFDLVP